MDATPTAGERRQAFRDAEGHGTIVFDPGRLQQAGPALFDPGNPDSRAQVVAGEGGRGSAWFVHGAYGDAVLRHYRRGGWMARLGREGFMWRGESRVRSLHEFRLLGRLRTFGLPVPAPIAAFYRRCSMRYQAAILVERIAGARSLASVVSELGKNSPWDAVGTAIGRCHAAGAHHDDLNSHNVLLDGDGSVHLIDWDKGRVEAATGPWCSTVIARLERSLRKQFDGMDASILGDGMQRIRTAHDRLLPA